MEEVVYIGVCTGDLNLEGGGYSPIHIGGYSMGWSEWCALSNEFF